MTSPLPSALRQAIRRQDRTRAKEGVRNWRTPTVLFGAKLIAKTLVFGGRCAAVNKVSADGLHLDDGRVLTCDQLYELPRTAAPTERRRQ